MKTPVKIALVLVGLAVLGGSIGLALAAYGSDGAVSLGPAPRVATSGTEIASDQPTVEVWFARDDRIVSVNRAQEPTPLVGTAALTKLLAGPSPAERRSGISSAVPAGTKLIGISIDKGIATADLTSEFQSGGGSLSMQMRLAQVVYTLTQFPTVKAVRFRLDGEPVDVFSSEGIVLDHPVGRSDYKDLAPTSPTTAGTWSLLPKAPIPAADLVLSAWTGKEINEMIVFGRVDKHGPAGSILGSTNVAAAYDPASKEWRRLPDPKSAPGYTGRWHAFWTGKKLLVLGDVNQAYDPKENSWSTFPAAPAGRAGIAAWTGKELVEWGGGCCGDVDSDGSAYDPEKGTWRTIAAAPVGGQQSPVGAWTGKELVIFPGRDPEGRPVAGAAYDPSRDTWRRLGSKPEPAQGARGVWDGSEILVTGGSSQYGLSTRGLAFDPSTGKWHRLAASSGRVGAANVWTGNRLLVWGGTTFPGASVTVRRGVGYEPLGNHWSPLPPSPLPGRVDPAAVWTGRDLLVWGGTTTKCLKNKSCHSKLHGDGAVFSPTSP
jgi:N-acetylneuraminic acid mutarotase